MVLLRKLFGDVIFRIVYNSKYNYRIHNRRLLYSLFFIIPDGGLLTALFFLWRCDLTRVMASSFLRFLDHTQRRTAVGRTPLDE
jgi:hypothetical protein